MATARNRTICLLILTGVLTEAVTCGGLALGIRATVRWLDPFEAHPFDAAAWAAADWNGRAAMARDAIRHLPVGLLETEIEPLLGKPDSVRPTRRLIASGPPGAARTYSYYLGSWSMVYYDDTYLWVHVGRDGRVVAAEIGGG